MADLVNITELNGGVPVTDGSGGYYYVVFPAAAVKDNFISHSNVLKDALKSNTYRAASDVAVTAGANSITFQLAGNPVPLDSANYSLMIREIDAPGIDNIVKTANGFTFDAIADGTIDYIAMINT